MILFSWAYQKQQKTNLKILDTKKTIFSHKMITNRTKYDLENENENKNETKIAIKMFLVVCIRTDILISTIYYLERDT